MVSCKLNFSDNAKFSHRVHEVERNDLVKNLSLVFIVFMSGALA